MATEAVPVEGWFMDQIIKRFIDLDGISKGDPAAIEQAVDLALKFLKLEEYEAGTDQFIRTAFKKDPYGAGMAVIALARQFVQSPGMAGKSWVPLTLDLLSAAEKAIEAYAPKNADGSIRVMATLDESEYCTLAGVSGRVPVRDMTRAQSQQWYAENRGQVRKGVTSMWAKCLTLNVLHRRAPEIEAMLDGTATPGAVGIDPERLARIMEILTVIANICSVTGAVYPPLIAVSIVLKLIVSFYESNNAVVSGGDRGLSLDDL